MSSAVSGMVAEKKTAIRPGLMVMLALMLLAAGWVLLADDEPVAKNTQAGQRSSVKSRAAAQAGAKGGEEFAAGLGGARSLRAVRQAGSAAQGPGAKVAEGTLLQGLQTYLASWQERGRFADLGEAGHAAWSSKLPPPPPPPKLEPPPPPPPPMAPPFPYQWIGRWAEPGAQAGSDLAVISGSNQTWVVKAGDVIEGQWRVDAVTEQTVRLTYLPLSQTQTISMQKT